MAKLSVVIITHNEEKNILRCLESVKPIADEIIVVDSMSSDNTVRMCRESSCRVFQREFDGYGTQKQFAVDRSSNDWVLSIDADEVVTEELQEEINHLLGRKPPPDNPNKEQPPSDLTQPEQPPLDLPQPGEEPSRIPDPGSVSGLPAAFLIPFSLYYMGRFLRHGGVGNESHLRLFDRTKGGFTTVPVHEGIQVNGTTGMLKGRIIHFSYRDISHHLEKIDTYTSRAAEGNRITGKSFSRINAVFKFPVVFFIYYIVKFGFLDGYPGFIWSFMAAVHSTLKIAKTIELSSKP